MMSLTRKQAELLDFIIGHLDETGVAPSFEEMKVGIGIASKSGVSRLMDGLEKRGHLRRTRFGRRSIELCNDLQGWADQALIEELSRRGYNVKARLAA